MKLIIQVENYYALNVYRKSITDIEGRCKIRLYVEKRASGQDDLLLRLDSDEGCANSQTSSTARSRGFDHPISRHGQRRPDEPTCRSHSSDGSVAPPATLRSQDCATPSPSIRRILPESE